MQYRCAIKNVLGTDEYQVVIEKREGNGPWKYDSTEATKLTKQEALLKQQEVQQRLPPPD